MKKNVFKLILLSSFAFSIYNCSENDIANENETNADVKSSSNTARISLTDKLKLPAGIKDESSIKWTESTGVVEILKSVKFSAATTQAAVDADKDGFNWTVPDIVKKIVIKSGVTVTGHFRLNNTVTITGENRSTSIIYGTAKRGWALGPNGKGDSPNCNAASGDDLAADCQKWTYGGISGNKEGAVYTIKNLTVKNARTYAITSFKSKIIMNNVYVVNTRPTDDNLGGDFNSNSDGISGGKGSEVLNCKFDVWDDSIKLYEDMIVKNVTIVQNGNGAAFQFGWGSKPITTHSISNVLINTKNVNYSNLTVFTVSGITADIPSTVNLGDFSVKIESTQKFRNTSKSLPLFLSKSTGKVNITIKQTGQNYRLIAPAGITKMDNSGNSIGGTFNVTGKICNNGFSTSALNTNCGNSSLVTGCGW